MNIEPLMYEDDDGQPVVRTARINHTTGKGFLVVRLIAAEEHLHAATAFARLFAAAPDLLAACEQALDFESQIGPHDTARGRNDALVEVLRAALAEVKGGE